MKQLFMRKNALRSATVRAEDVPAPRCGAGNVLLANRYSLISAGTETAAVGRNKRDMILKAMRDPVLRQSVVDMFVQDGVLKTVDRVQYEMTKWTPLGYSGAGVAVEVGRDVDGIQAGDAVAYGGEGHAEYVRVAKNLCVRIPQGISAKDAAFVAVGSIALQAVRRADVQVGEVVAVLGMGLVGQLVAQLLSASGARVLGSDLLPRRLDLGRSLGLEVGFVAGEQLPQEVMRYTRGLGVDRAVICAATSSSKVVEQAVAMARDRGRIVVVGMVGLDIPCEEFYRKELDLVISRSYGPGRYDRNYEEHGIDYPLGYVRWTERRNMEEFLRLIQSGKVCLSPLISHEYSLEEADRAYELLMTRPSECLAVLLRYDELTEPPDRSRAVASQPAELVSNSSGNLAVIGCGSFARQFHLPNLKHMNQLRFRTLVASSGQSAKEMALRYGAEQCSGDAQTVWDDPTVDAVMILTRDKSHAALTAAAIQVGKHVFCEKPLATTYEECELIRSTAAGSHLVCMTGFNRRFAPFVQKAKQFLDTCRGPRIIHYRVNAGPMPKDSWIYDPVHAAGRIVGEACHFIDLCYWLIGAEPVRVTANAFGECPSTVLMEDVSSTFEFADGSVATLLYTASGSSLSGKERLEVFCDCTSVLIDDFRSLTVRGRANLDMRNRRTDKGHAAELQHFADVITGKNRPIIDYRDGIRATICCLKLIESARQAESVEIDATQWL